MWFSAGIVSLVIGYALLYTAIANASNGMQGPRLWESLGLPATNAPGKTTDPGAPVVRDRPSWYPEWLPLPPGF